MRKHKDKASKQIRIVYNFRRCAVKRPALPPTPTAEDVEKNVALIQEAKVIHGKLLRAGIDIRSMARIMAYLQRDEQIWATIRVSRERQIKRISDNLHKTEMRHPKGQRIGRAKLRQRIATLHGRRIAIEDDPLYRNWLSGTKRRPHLGRYILLLERLLGNTKKPFHFMAALLGLMPEGVCDQCKERECKPGTIFRCKRIEVFQKDLWQIARVPRGKTPLPADFLERVEKEVLEESERQKKQSGIGCPDCKDVFEDGQALLLHLVGQHGWKKEHATFQVECEVRDVERGRERSPLQDVLPNKDEVAMSQSQGIKKEEFRCPDCDEIFTNGKSFLLHLVYQHGWKRLDWWKFQLPFKSSSRL